MSLNAERPHVRGSKHTWSDDKPARLYGQNGAEKAILRDEVLTPWEKLAMFIIIQAADDIRRRNSNHQDYASAHYFITDERSPFGIFEQCLDLDVTRDKLMGLINGRPLQGLLL